MLARRHSLALSLDDAATLDRKIRAKYMTSATALMLDFDCSVVADPDVQLAQEWECITSVKALMDSYNAYDVDQVLYIFEDPAEAVDAALRTQEYLLHRLDEMEDGQGQALVLKGFGLHSGEMLCMHNAEFSWGEPIAVSCTLAQECAKDGDVLVSSSVYDTIRHDTRFRTTAFQLVEGHPTDSEVAFKYYRIAGTVEEAPLCQSVDACHAAVQSHCSWWPDSILPRFLQNLACCNSSSHSARPVRCCGPAPADTDTSSSSTIKNIDAIPSIPTVASKQHGSHLKAWQADSAEVI